MADDRDVDEHLGAVLNEVLDAVYQSKQAAWSATSSPLQPWLRDLVSFLIEQSGLVMKAEESIGGRAPGMASPSSHQRGNLLAEAHGDLPSAVAVLLQRLDDLTTDVRRRAVAISGTTQSALLTELADGLEARLARLRST